MLINVFCNRQILQVHISASIGVTFFPRNANTSDDLVRNADQAMYVAKNAGRNCCRFFPQDMQDEAVARSASPTTCMTPSTAS